MAGQPTGDECRHRRSPLLIGFFFLCAAGDVSAAVQHKVGDLDAWGPPPSSKPDVYSIWSQSRSFQIGDSLMFLYPPSQDAVVQVTAAAFESCSVGEPILRMDDGYSLFDITSADDLFFTSGIPGRCEKNQRLRISVVGGNGTSSSSAGSLPIVFGPAMPPSQAPAPTAGIAMATVNALLVLLFQSLRR